jgi:hypothetical protein
MVGVSFARRAAGVRVVVTAGHLDNCLGKQMATFHIPITAVNAQSLTNAYLRLQTNPYFSDFYANVNRRVANAIQTRADRGFFDTVFVYFNDGINLNTSMLNALVSELARQGFTVTVEHPVLHISWLGQPRK